MGDWSTFEIYIRKKPEKFMIKQTEKLTNNKVSIEDSACSIRRSGVGVGLQHCPKLRQGVRLFICSPSLNSNWPQAAS